LIGKDRQTILKTVKEISSLSKENDAEAIKKEKLLKYIVEVYGKEDGILNEVRTYYSDSYVFIPELIKDHKIDSWNRVRGPFPLKNGALANAKLNRWEHEKKKLEEDAKKMNDCFNEAKTKEYKYGYVLHDEMFGLKRILEIKFTESVLSQKEIQVMLNSSESKQKVSLNRIKLCDGSEKIYT
jgi:hypothetical protein